VKKNSYTISELKRLPVHMASNPKKRIGKVHAFVFHPTKRRVVGFSVKRPDIAWMMHRPDLFVAFDCFEVSEGMLMILDGKKGAVGQSACRRLGIDWDTCVLWQGLPLMTQSSKRLGFVGDVRFRAEDGLVEALLVDRGASADALLGVTEIPGTFVKGFRLGVGDQLNTADENDFLKGALIVSDEVCDLAPAGGLAERAGKASAVVNKKVSDAVDKARPVAADAAHKTGEAVNRGAYAVGRQLHRTKGMFSAFKEEYQRARHGEEAPHDEKQEKASE